MAVDPFAHLRGIRADGTSQHLDDDQFRRSLKTSTDINLLLYGVFIGGQCAALEDLSLGGLADARIERMAKALKATAALLDDEGRARGLDLYGPAGKPYS